MINDFFTQWLGLEELPTETKDATLYPTFDKIKPSIIAETSHFLADIIKADGGRLDSLLGTPTGDSPACSPLIDATSRRSSTDVSRGMTGSIPDDDEATIRATSPSTSAVCSRNSSSTRRVTGSSIDIPLTLRPRRIAVMTEWSRRMTDSSCST